MSTKREPAGTASRAPAPRRQWNPRPRPGREQRSPEPVPRRRSRPRRASLEIHPPANGRGAARDPTRLPPRPPGVVSTSAAPRDNAPLAGRAAPNAPAGARGFDRRRRGHGRDRHPAERRTSVVRICSRRHRAAHYAREGNSRGGEQPVRATGSGSQSISTPPGATSARAPDGGHAPATAAGAEARGRAREVHAAIRRRQLHPKPGNFQRCRRRPHRSFLTARAIERRRNDR